MSEVKNKAKEVRDGREQLRDYETLKFELAALGRAIMAERHEPRDSAFHQEYQDFTRRLADDQFNLAVVGQFNRGKTSLMNAVLATDRLPTGIVPLTSVITVVRYGSRESAWAEYENSSLRHEISFNDLPAYVTQEGNPGNEKRIRFVEIQLPAEILRRGFCFVDTPGLGSAIPQNTSTTDRYLPQADAIVFVTSCDAPLSELEIEYLRNVRRLVRKVFVVINKIDLLADHERERVVQFVRERIDCEGLFDVPLYALSAREGLQAKARHELTSLQPTGLPEFEQALIQFLVTDKAREFLVQNCDRLMRIAPGITGDNSKLITEIAELRTRVSGQAGAATHDAIAIPQSTAPRTCPVCRTATQAVGDFLAKYQYEISHRPEEQLKHASVHGFCPLHSWQYERLASPRGVCSAYPLVLRNIARELQESCATGGGSSIVEAIQHLTPRCPTCQVQRNAEDAVVRRLAASLHEFRGVVCLPHLRLLVGHVDDDMAQMLVARYAHVLKRIEEDMERFVLRRDGLRRDLMSEEELRAHCDGLGLLAGDRGLASSAAHEVWL